MNKQNRYIYANDGSRWCIINLANKEVGWSYNGEWIDGEIVEECRTRDEARRICRMYNEGQR